MEQTPPNKTIDILGKKYEVISVSVLNPNLIAQGDRVFIQTRSGNRYMVRRSRSRNGFLMIYNEKDGFSEGAGNVIHNQKEIIAKIGEPMKMWIVTDEAKSLGGEISSTEVSSIEIRKGVDDVLNSTPDAQKTRSLTERLKDQATGKK